MLRMLEHMHACQIFEKFAKYKPILLRVDGFWHAFCVTVTFLLGIIRIQMDRSIYGGQQDTVFSSICWNFLNE